VLEYGRLLQRHHHHAPIHTVVHDGAGQWALLGYVHQPQSSNWTCYWNPTVVRLPSKPPSGVGGSRRHSLPFKPSAPFQKRSVLLSVAFSAPLAYRSRSSHPRSSRGSSRRPRTYRAA